MRKFALLLLICVPCLAGAQVFRVQFGYSMLSYEQHGQIYSEQPNHILPLYEATDINRKLRSSGFTIDVYYPLNFGTRSFEYFSYGPQLACTINTSSLDQSFDKKYKSVSSSLNLRVPLLLSCRIGGMSPANRFKIGLSAGSGFEFIKLSVADQTGTFLLPVEQISASLGKFVFAVNIYPMSIESVYVNNGVEIPRLTTSFIEFRFMIGLDGVSKRYHNDYKPAKRTRKR